MTHEPALALYSDAAGTRVPVQLSSASRTLPGIQNLAERISLIASQNNLTASKPVATLASAAIEVCYCQLLRLEFDWALTLVIGLYQTTIDGCTCSHFITEPFTIVINNLPFFTFSFPDNNTFPRFTHHSPYHRSFIPSGSFCCCRSFVPSGTCAGRTGSNKAANSRKHRYGP